MFPSPSAIARNLFEPALLPNRPMVINLGLRPAKQLSGHTKPFPIPQLASGFIFSPGLHAGL
jgi:hypothetical protein